MNSRRFDRNTIERYISKGYDIQKFMKKYDIADEEEFRTHLLRIYSDEPKKVDLMLSDMKRKNKREQRKSTSKSSTNIKTNTAIPAPNALSVISAKTLAVEQNVYLPVNKDNTPYTVAETNLSDLTKLVKKTAEESKPEEGDIQLSDLEKLKIELSENEDYLVELSNDISEKKIAMDSKISEMQVSLNNIKELKKKIEEERIRFISLIQGIDEIEGQCLEQMELKKILAGDIAELKEQIEQLETKKLFFGNGKDGEYDFYAEDIQIPAMVLMNKFNELAVTGNYEEFSLANLRTLARMLCVIDDVANKNDKIKIIITNGDYTAEVIESLKALTEYVIVVVK